MRAIRCHSSLPSHKRNRKSLLSHGLLNTIVATALATTGLIASPQPGYSATPLWTGQTSADWGVATNWSSSLLPGVNDIAQFDGNGLVTTVTLSSAYSIKGLSFVDSAPAYTITAAPGASGLAKLTLPSSGLSSIENASSASFQTLAVRLDFNGRQLVVNTTNSNSTTLFTGNSEMNYGSFSVRGAGTTKITGSIVNTITNGTSGSGSVSVGDGATTSKLLIAQGGSLLGGDGNVNSGATALVEGAGSRWQTGGTLYVNANGKLAIKSGGKVESTGKTEVGQTASSSAATVTVEGTNSTWVTGRQLFVGENGTGTVLITSGGQVLSSIGDSYLGYGSGSKGTVTVDGSGSNWQSGNLSVGYGGTGLLQITGGGKVSSAYSTIAGADGSFFPVIGQGSVTVDGAGSEWNNSGNLTVGYHGTGTLNVTNGGKVTSANGSIGTGAASFITGSAGTGNVVVQGVGSQWNNTGTLAVGESGVGTLAINDGGAVNVGGETSVNAQSTLTINGGTLTTGSLRVADANHTIALSNKNGVSALVIGSNNSSSFTGVLKDGTGGAGGLTKVGTGTLTLTGNNTYTGATKVAAGTLKLNGSNQSGQLLVDQGATLDFSGQNGFQLKNGQKLINNGKVSGLTAPITAVGGALVGGSGDFSGIGVKIGEGGILSPGNSPGTFSIASMTWDGDGTYLWEINKAAGITGVNSDLALVSGILTIDATNADPFTISLSSLMVDNQAGQLAGWNTELDQSWTILTAQGGINGFDSSKFVLDTSDFTDDNFVNAASTFTLSKSNNSLILNYHFVAVPEGSTGVLVLLGLLPGGYIGIRMRLRKRY